MKPKISKRSASNPISAELPVWVGRQIAKWPKKLPSDSAALMRYAVELLEVQIEKKTGGPFAALLVSNSSRQLVAVGLNRVVPLNDPTAHAECIAIRHAAKQLKQFQFNGDYTLVTTAQMCGMCMTASLWAGVGKIIIGATAKDTERLTGFDEGIISPNWKSQLKRRGIVVEQNILRTQVCQLLKRYVESGGLIYNGNRQS